MANIRPILFAIISIIEYEYRILFDQFSGVEYRIRISQKVADIRIRNSPISVD
jgi:hypothetical protein